MVPFAEAYSDARRNLVVSLIFAARPQVAEVCVFFHDVLLRGNRVIKRDALGLAAFDSPNLPPLARIGVAMSQARFLSVLGG